MQKEKERMTDQITCLDYYHSVWIGKLISLFMACSIPVVSIILWIMTYSQGCNLQTYPLLQVIGISGYIAIGVAFIGTCLYTYYPLRIIKYVSGILIVCLNILILISHIILYTSPFDCPNTLVPLIFISFFGAISTIYGVMLSFALCM